MFDYKTNFDEFCKVNKLKLTLSFDMPEGYETANGMFDVEEKIVYINREMLKDSPDFEQAFYLFHELRHAVQYICHKEFDDCIIKSLQYVIMFDGTCYKLVDGKYLECKLRGDDARFLQLYKGQPYEVDANNFAYEQVKEIFGKLSELRDLYEFFMPSISLSPAEYDEIYELIDKELA